MRVQGRTMRPPEIGTGQMVVKYRLHRVSRSLWLALWGYIILCLLHVFFLCFLTCEDMSLNESFKTVRQNKSFICCFSRHYFTAWVPHTHMVFRPTDMWTWSLIRVLGLQAVIWLNAVSAASGYLCPVYLRKQGRRVCQRTREEFCWWLEIGFHRRAPECFFKSHFSYVSDLCTGTAYKYQCKLFQRAQFAGSTFVNLT